MKVVTQDCDYPEPVDQLVRLKLNFTFHLHKVFELIVIGKWKCSLAIDMFWSNCIENWEKKQDKTALHLVFVIIFLLK